MVLCPDCESDLDLDEGDLDEGDVVDCPECGAEFEVVSIGPLELTKIDGGEEGEGDDDQHEGDEDDEDE